MIDEQESLPPANEEKISYDRRRWMTTSAAVAGALFAAGGAKGQENLKQVEQAQHNQSATDPGPDNKQITAAQPDADVPPATDQGNPPNFWSSFSAQHRRIQGGGWARQVTVREFPISTTIAGVNMRLTPGGCRELHWHATAEWAIMLTGKARITNMDDEGKMFVADVGPGDLWFSRKATRIRFKAWSRTAASFCWFSMMGNSRRTTRRCFLPGCGTRHRKCWQRTCKRLHPLSRNRTIFLRAANGFSKRPFRRLSKRTARRLQSTCLCLRMILRSD
jgi:hypothetical protein